MVKWGERESLHPHEAPIDFARCYAQMEFFDDVKGCPLDKEQVIGARRLEMEPFKNTGVYEGPNGGGQGDGSQCDHHELGRHH